MIKRIPWVERKFDFNFPLGLFLNILGRLRGTPARLEEMIQSMPSGILTIRVNGGWSIQEHAGHLIDLEELHGGRIDDYLARTAVLRAADMENKKTFQANHNERPISEIFSMFRVVRSHFVDRLESLDDETHAFASLHPRLKQPMRPVDFAFFVAEHDDHHLASITEISRVLQSQK